MHPGVEPSLHSRMVHVSTISILEHGNHQQPCFMSFSHLYSNTCLYIPKLPCEQFNMSIYSPFIHCLKDNGGAMFFWKYDLAHSGVWCPALACHCQLDYIPLKIHMLKFYLPVLLIVFLFGDSLYRGYNKISLYRSENNIRVGPNQIGLMSLFSSVQLLSRVSLFATPWTAAHQAFLSITNSWSLLKFMSIESVMSSNHLILCCSLLLLPSILPSIRVFSNETVLRIR